MKRSTKVSSSSSKGTKAKRFTAYERNVHGSSRTLFLSVNDSMRDILYDLYKNPRRLDALTVKANYEGDAAGDEFMRAYKAKDGSPEFLAACRLWLSSQRLGNKFWNPAIDEANRKRSEKREKYLATPAGQAAEEKRRQEADKKAAEKEAAEEQQWADKAAQKAAEAKVAAEVAAREAVAYQKSAAKAAERLKAAA